MLRLVQTGTVEAIDGSTTHIDADSICVHGDSPGSIQMAREVRQLLEQSGVSLQSFTGAAR